MNEDEDEDVGGGGVSRSDVADAVEVMEAITEFLFLLTERRILPR